MAQSTQVAIANSSTYIQGGITYEITTSGSNIHVIIRLYFRRTNTYAGATSSSSVTQYLAASGAASNWVNCQTGAITVNGGQQNVWQGRFAKYERDFDASRGGQTIYIGWKTVDNYQGYFSGEGQTTITLPTVATSPTGLSVSNIRANPDGFTANVSITGWGTGGTTSGRYRELQAWTNSSSGLVELRRYQAVFSSDLSGDITVNNSSSGSLNIQPNTTYVIGAYASNGAASAGSMRVGQYTTSASVPETPTISVSSATKNSITISYGTSSFNGSGTVYLFGGTSADPTNLLESKTTTGQSTYTYSGLQPNTRYYFRTYATNGTPTSYASVTTGTRPEDPWGCLAATSLDGKGYLGITAMLQGSAKGNLELTGKYKLNSSDSNWTTMTIGSSDSYVYKLISNPTAGTYKPVIRFSNTYWDCATDFTCKNSVEVGARPTIYCSPNGTTRFTKELYIGVDNKSTLITKMYEGVNGVAKLVYDRGLGHRNSFIGNISWTGSKDYDPGVYDESGTQLAKYSSTSGVQDGGTTIYSAGDSTSSNPTRGETYTVYDMMPGKKYYFCCPSYSSSYPAVFVGRYQLSNLTSLTTGGVTPIEAANATGSGSFWTIGYVKDGTWTTINKLGSSISTS